MPTLIAAFDTNLYRGLGPERFDRLRDLERGKSVQAVASYAVATELLSHLHQVDDPDYGSSFAGLSRLWNHCKTYNGSQYVTELVASPQELLSFHIFDAEPSATLAGHHVYGSTIGRIVNEAGTWRTDARAIAVVAAIHKFVQASEEGFVDDLWQALVRAFPEAKTWADLARPTAARTAFLEGAAAGQHLPLAASLIVRSAARALSIPYGSFDLDSCVERLLTAYPLPVHFWSRMIARIVRTGVDMSAQARRNSTWDFQVSFATAKGATFESIAPVWLVTEDSEVLEAAEAAGMSWNVWRLSAYEALLSGPDADFRRTVDADPGRGHG